MPPISCQQSKYLLTVPDDLWQDEIVDGRLVRMPGSGNVASSIALYLGSRSSRMRGRASWGV